MRKRITGRSDSPPSQEQQWWIDLDQSATVEVTSEHPGFPIESVFGEVRGPGWRAADPGEQTIRILFDEPRTLRRIQLEFHESAVERSQEFSIRWASARDGAWKEIHRQQWNFSPAGSQTELEDYAVNLENVSALELAIAPDIHRHHAPATLRSWRLA